LDGVMILEVALTILLVAVLTCPLLAVAAAQRL
jgi:hypothetical protein